MGRLLEAFVQFSTRGVDGVLGAADRVEQKIRGVEANARIKFVAEGLDTASTTLDNLRAKLMELHRGVPMPNVAAALGGIESISAAIAKARVQLDEAKKTGRVELAVSGLSGVNAAIDGVRGKLGDLRKSSEIKFVASGLNSVESAVNSIKQKMATFAHSHDLTHALATGIEEAVHSAGEGAVTALTAGLGAAVGGAIGAAFGQQIAAMASAVPNLIGHQIDLSREAAKLDRRSLTEEERAQWYGVTGAGRLYWSHFTIGGKGGAELFQEGIERLQLNGPAPAVPTTPEERAKYNAEMKQKAAEAEAIMNQAMTLATMGRVSDPVGFAETLDKLRVTHRPRYKMALAGQEYVFSRLQEKYPDASPEQIQNAVRLKDTQAGAITSEELIAAAVGDVASPRTTKYLGAKVQEWSRAHGSEAGAQLWQGQNQLHPDELEYIRRRRAGQTPRQAIKSPGEWNPNPEGIPSYGPPRMLNISADQQARLDRLFRAESGDASALSGMTPRDVPAHQLAAASGASTYQFTSITGLAEKMQLEASGQAGDVGERQLHVLERIATNTERQPVEHPNSPASAPTHLAPYHQHH